MNKKAKKQCRSKILYTSPADAWAHAYALRRSGVISARVYKCKGTKGQTRHWHVTSGVKKGKR